MNPDKCRKLLDTCKHCILSRYRIHSEAHQHSFLHIQPIHPRPSSTNKSTKSVGSVKMHVLCRSDYRQDTDDKKDEAVHISLSGILPRDNPPSAVKKLTIFASLLGWYRGVGAVVGSRDK